MLVRARRRSDGLFFTRPIDPHERARVRPKAANVSRQIHVHERPVGGHREIARAGARDNEVR